jgi:Domain of unknown function (DUF4277)
VAGLVDEIGIVDILNKRLGIDSREKVSTGVIVKAMLLNGLGFVSAPLYLFGQFFQGCLVRSTVGKPDERASAKQPNSCWEKESSQNT